MKTKLPEQYAKWVDGLVGDGLSSPDKDDYAHAMGFRTGAKLMYRKLANDLSPAIKALKHCAYDDHSDCGKVSEEAIAQLVEKGLMR